MNTLELEAHRHDHEFGSDRVTRGERRTLLVALLTAGFMVIELAAGYSFGSMALLADGLHMGSHAMALGIAVAAYVYTRRNAADPRFSFGTGKVNALAGFAGAVMLAGFALVMAAESVERMLQPVSIGFEQSIAVAVVGLLVNLVSVAILGVGGDESDGHGHGHSHAHDHNLRSAYLHVLADALTSVTAIVALLGGKYLGLSWLDPAVGILGAVLVARWAWGLLRQTSGVLLDFQAPARFGERVRVALEAPGDAHVVDLHIWSIGPGLWAACVTLLLEAEATEANYRERLPAELGLCHVTIEARRSTAAAQ